MTSPRSESFLVLPLFPIFLAGAFPFFLMGFLGFAGIGVLGALMMSAALTVGLDADAEFNAQSFSVGSFEASLQSTQRDAMVRFAKAAGAAGAVMVAIAIAGLATGA